MSMSRHLRALKFMMRNYFMPKDVKPPFRHVCQIGDPVLRRPAELVKPELIPTKDIKNIIYILIQTMKLYDAVGLSAPQIGVPLQIFVAELTQKHWRAVGPTKRKAFNIEVFPLKVFINPVMKIVDHTKFTSSEGCVSTAHFEADVPRFKEVIVTGLNPLGETETWHAKDWAAKIAQHEIDHLKGHLFTDKMDPTTLALVNWDVINSKRGRVKLALHP